MAALFAAATYELVIQLQETAERKDYYAMARDYCDRVGKPLLRIGMRRSFLEPPNGDFTLDIDPAVLKVPGGVLGDERDMPFADKQFGASFNEHTLEHLRDAESVQAAVNECVRVADMAIFLAPSPYSIYASLFCPTHNLRLWFDEEKNTIRVEKNKLSTGLGFTIGYSQAILTTDKAPNIITYENAFAVIN